MPSRQIGALRALADLGARPAPPPAWRAASASKPAGGPAARHEVDRRCSRCVHSRSRAQSPEGGMCQSACDRGERSHGRPTHLGAPLLWVMGRRTRRGGQPAVAAAAAKLEHIHWGVRQAPASREVVGAIWRFALRLSAGGRGRGEGKPQSNARPRRPSARPMSGAKAGFKSRGDGWPTLASARLVRRCLLQCCVLSHVPSMSDRGLRNRPRSVPSSRLPRRATRLLSPRSLGSVLRPPGQDREPLTDVAVRFRPSPSPP